MEVFNVYWSNYDSKHQYIIGILIHDNYWYFKYHNEINEAIEKGFRPFPDMTDLQKLYKDEELFKVFRIRYPQYSNNVIQMMKSTNGDLVTDKILIKHVNQKVESHG